MTGPKRKAMTGPLREEAWRLDAACADASKSEQRIMTSTRSAVGASSREARRVARKYCTHCPVTRECADWAMGELYFAGIAGGMRFGWEKNKAATYAGRKVTPV